MATAAQFNKIAQALKDVTETVACAGTAIEQASFKVGKKSFLFVQSKDGGVVVRLKLGTSSTSASKHDAVEIGVGGWATIRLEARQAMPRDARKWVKESYALSVGADGASPKKKKTAKKKTAKKETAKKKTAKKKTAKKKTAKKKTAKKRSG